MNSSLSNVPDLPLGDKDILVVSDLHMGDGGRRDNFVAFQNGARERAWGRFLDYVESRNAQLVVVGDLFEFWQCNLSLVLVKRKAYLDRLGELKAIYVLGNHDNDLVGFIECNMLSHPVFARMNAGFKARIGGKTFRFLHGHETDPWNSDPNPNRGRIAAIVAGIAEDKVGGPYSASGESVEKQLEDAAEAAKGLGERILEWLEHKISPKPGHEGLTPVQKPSLYQEHLLQMMKLHDEERDSVLVVGHTHKPGHVADGWYWNSGSWAEKENDFLEIKPDGSVTGKIWLEDRSEEKNISIDLPPLDLAKS